ncbi:MAG: Hint domain-containing protein [Minicystis sp.]
MRSVRHRTLAAMFVAALGAKSGCAAPDEGSLGGAVPQGVGVARQSMSEGDPSSPAEWVDVTYLGVAERHVLTVHSAVLGPDFVQHTVLLGEDRREWLSLYAIHGEAETVLRMPDGDHRIAGPVDAGEVVAVATALGFAQGFRRPPGGGSSQEPFGDPGADGAAAAAASGVDPEDCFDGDFDCSIPDLAESALSGLLRVVRFGDHLVDKHTVEIFHLFSDNVRVDFLDCCLVHDRDYYCAGKIPFAEILGPYGVNHTLNSCIYQKVRGASDGTAGLLGSFYEGGTDVGYGMPIWSWDVAGWNDAASRWSTRKETCLCGGSKPTPVCKEAKLGSPDDCRIANDCSAPVPDRYRLSAWPLKPETRCDGKCRPEGSTACFDGKIRVCVNGMYTANHDCPSRTCRDRSTCEDLCQKPMSRCYGDWIQRCNDKGTWDTEPCPSGLRCVLGACAQGGGGSTGGGSSCFPAGVRVSMADGTMRPIESVEVGDFVLGFDERTGMVAPHRVSRRFVHTNVSDPLVRINDALSATGNHLVYVSGAWQRADALAVGAPLKTLSPDAALVSARVASLATEGRTVPVVYNLEVDDVHTYFAEGVLVHNYKNIGSSGGETVQPGGGAGVDPTVVPLDGSGADVGDTRPPCSPLVPFGVSGLCKPDACAQKVAAEQPCPCGYCLGGGWSAWCVERYQQCMGIASGSPDVGAGQ